MNRLAHAAIFGVVNDAPMAAAGPRQRVSEQILPFDELVTGMAVRMRSTGGSGCQGRG
ncbi:hypothetical protein [Streptomyces sp. NPDC058674]|uniref:hypothetical protein n=1 Tax=Streptomyces sp. NPDC058674 TaxID=3346592 RepID=UPI00365D526D